MELIQIAAQFDRRIMHFGKVGGYRVVAVDKVKKAMRPRTVFQWGGPAARVLCFMSLRSYRKGAVVNPAKLALEFARKQRES
jgi:hypothetical protein